VEFPETVKSPIGVVETLVIVLLAVKLMVELLAHAVVKGPEADIPQFAAVNVAFAPFVFQYNCA